MSSHQNKVVSHKEIVITLLSLIWELNVEAGGGWASCAPISCSEGKGWKGGDWEWLWSEGGLREAMIEVCPKVNEVRVSHGLLHEYHLF